MPLNLRKLTRVRRIRGLPSSQLPAAARASRSEGLQSTDSGCRPARSVCKAICRQIVEGPNGNTLSPPLDPAWVIGVGSSAPVEPVVDERDVHGSHGEVKLPSMELQSPAYWTRPGGMDHILVCVITFPIPPYTSTKYATARGAKLSKIRGCPAFAPARGVLSRLRNPRFLFGVSQPGNNPGNLSVQLAWAGPDRSPRQCNERGPRVTQATLGNYRQCADPANPSTTTQEGRFSVRFVHPCPAHGERTPSDLRYGVRRKSGSGCAINGRGTQRQERVRGSAHQ